MSQHAEGPWAAFPSKIRWYGRKPIFDNGLWHILPESNLEQLPIATVDFGDDHDPETRARAEEYAHLISAAPQLLEACHAICMVMAYEPHETLTSALNGAYNKARAAIQKAEGNS